MAESEVRRPWLCQALGREVEVLEVHDFRSTGACPVTQSLLELSCSGEPECRARGLYSKCELWTEYEKLYG